MIEPGHGLKLDPDLIRQLVPGPSTERQSTICWLRRALSLNPPHTLKFGYSGQVSVLIAGLGIGFSV